MSSNMKNSSGNNKESQSDLNFDTLALHAGSEENFTQALVPPIFQTSVFELENVDMGAEFCAAHNPSEFYTRWGNPTISQAQKVLAQLEGAEAALLFSSGMGAISAALLGALDPGSHVVIHNSMYAGSTELVRGFFKKIGVEHTFVDATNLKEVESAVQENTSLIFIESPSNPVLGIIDLEAIADIGKHNSIKTAVDSTLASPYLQRPIELGFDIVLHSGTKYLGGHSDLTAGVLASSESFIQECWKYLKLFGACISPFEAWLLLRGVKTLPLRVQQQCNNAFALAKFLESLDEVERVYYPFLDSHPQKTLAERQMQAGGGMVSFELKGGKGISRRFVESLKVIRLAVSLGGVESIIQHPATMTHGMLSEEDLAASGISPGLLRCSVGIEDVEDLKRDIEQALR